MPWGDRVLRRCWPAPLRHLSPAPMRGGRATRAGIAASGGGMRTSALTVRLRGRPRQRANQWRPAAGGAAAAGAGIGPTALHWFNLPLHAQVRRPSAEMLRHASAALLTRIAFPKVWLRNASSPLHGDGHRRWPCRQCPSALLPSSDLGLNRLLSFATVDVLAPPTRARRCSGFIHVAGHARPSRAPCRSPGALARAAHRRVARSVDACGCRSPLSTALARKEVHRCDAHHEVGRTFARWRRRPRR